MGLFPHGTNSRMFSALNSDILFRGLLRQQGDLGFTGSEFSALSTVGWQEAGRVLLRMFLPSLHVLKSPDIPFSKTVPAHCDSDALSKPKGPPLLRGREEKPVIPPRFPDSPGPHIPARPRLHPSPPYGGLSSPFQNADRLSPQTQNRGYCFLA